MWLIISNFQVHLPITLSFLSFETCNNFQFSSFFFGAAHHVRNSKTRALYNNS